MAVEEQMEMAFGEKPEVDPVSGNEVPTGSLPEEVRDDIPAQLSEGEYVIPADVVRYYGVRFFEQLRTKAKQGWDAMERNGRIGGEPIGMETIEPEDDLPFDISELEVYDDEEGEMPEMNRGGYISGYQEGGMVDVPPTPIGYTTNTGIEMRPYEGPDGAIIYIQFVNGRPISYIPPSYRPKQSVEDEVATEAASTAEKPDEGDALSQGRVNEPDDTFEVDWATAKPEEFESYMKQRDSKTFRAVQAGSLALGPIGGLFHAATRAQYNSMKSGLATQIEEAMKAGDKAKVAALTKIQEGILKYEEENPMSAGKSVIYGGGTGLTDGLKDTDDSGEVDFGDTFLGDLLGFDDDGIGIQDKPGLVASLKGDRRDLGGDNDENDTGNTVPDTVPTAPTRPSDLNTNIGGGDRNNENTGNSSSRSDNSNVGNWGGDRDGDGVPNAVDFDDGVGWADRSKG